MRQRGEPLGHGHVGDAEHPDVAVAVGQAGRPLHRVVAILGAAANDVVRVAVGREATPGVLEDHDVVVGHDTTGVERGRQRDPRMGLVVRGTGQQDGEPARLVRPPDVGAQHDAVAHDAFHVGLEDDRCRAHVRSSAGMLAAQPSQIDHRGMQAPPRGAAPGATDRPPRPPGAEREPIATISKSAEARRRSTSHDGGELPGVGADTSARIEVRSEQWRRPKGRVEPVAPDHDTAVAGQVGAPGIR